MRMLIDIVGVVVFERARVIGARAVGSQQCVLALLNEFITPVSSLWKRNLERGGCSSPPSPSLEPPLIMTLALALAITLRTRRAILSLPWTAQHQSNTRNTATGFTWHPFVVARWVRVYPKVLLRSQFCLN